LAERSGDLGNGKTPERKGTIVLFKENDGRIDLASQGIQSIRGTGRRRSQGHQWRIEIDKRRAKHRLVIDCTPFQARENRLLEKFVGVDLDGVVAGGK